MKEKPIFVSLIVAVCLLLGVAGVLTSILFKMAIPSPSPEDTSPSAIPPRDSSAPAVASIDIELPSPGLPSSSSQRVAGAPLPSKLPPEPAPAISPLTQDTPANIPSGAIGRVVTTRGTALAIDTAMRRRPLAADAAVFARETIETGPSARISIEFKDGSTIFQGESTSIVLDEYVYDPNRKEVEPRFAMRLLSGICRVVSGMITADHKEERLQVKTRMSSIGIRGCELAFRSDKTQDDVFVMSLGPGETVRVETTANGTPLNNIATGLPLPVDPVDRKVIEVSASRTHVSMAQGRPPRETEITPDAMRDILTDTTHLTPSRHELTQKPDGALITIPPAPQQPPPGATGAPK